VAELSIPRDAVVTVTYQALENSNGKKMDELRDSRRNYQRLKDVYEKERFLAHTYDK